MTEPARPPRRRPAVVLFDMDDTLFDHTRTCELALTRLRRNVAALQRTSLTEILQRYAVLLDTIYPLLSADLAEHERARDERFRRLFEFVGEPVSTEEAHRYSTEYRAFYQSARTAVPGAPELLDALRGKVTVGIVSNNHQEEQLDKLRALGLSDRVDFVVTSQLAGSAKPAPAIFARALAEAGREPHEAVMVGDTWRTDVLGARSAGIPAVWFDRRGEAPPLAPDVRVLRSLSPTDHALRVLLEGDGAVPG
ncbi:MAG: HAD family hydrolase [Thermoplasmata archaeon]